MATCSTSPTTPVTAPSPSSSARQPVDALVLPTALIDPAQPLLLKLRTTDQQHLDETHVQRRHSHEQQSVPDHLFPFSLKSITAPCCSTSNAPSSSRYLDIQCASVSSEVGTRPLNDELVIANATSPPSQYTDTTPLNYPHHSPQLHATTSSASPPSMNTGHDPTDSSDPLHSSTNNSIVISSIRANLANHPFSSYTDQNTSNHMFNSPKPAPLTLHDFPRTHPDLPFFIHPSRGSRFTSALAPPGKLGPGAASFHVVGVLPAPRSTSNRVTIFLAPLHKSSPPAQPTSLSTATSSESLKSISISCDPPQCDVPPSFCSTAGPNARSASALHVSSSNPFPVRGFNSGPYVSLSTQSNYRTPLARHVIYNTHSTPNNTLSGHTLDADDLSFNRSRQSQKPVHGTKTNSVSENSPNQRQYACDTRLKEINLNEFNSRSIFVRFSTSDSNPNEKVVSAEWKGRARSNELYTTNRMGPRIEITRPSGNNGDKSGFVFLNTLCKAAKMQSVYLSSELRDAGLFQGAFFPALWLKLSDVPDRTLENLRIACAWSYDDTLTEFVEPADMKVVYGPKTILHGEFHLGWLRFQLDVPMEWDGKRNLLLELSKDETHASFSWPATGGLFFKSTSAIRTVAHKDNNDSSGQWPFATWTKPARFRRVPVMAVESICPPSYKIICQVPEATFHNSLVKVEVSLDGVHFCKSVATYVHHDPDPAALGRVLSDLARLLPRPESLDTSPLMDQGGLEVRSELSMSFHDVVFLVGPTPTPFRAHQAILASRSPVFQRMFASPEGTRDSEQLGNIVTPTPREILVTEISPAIFSLVLQFIYTASISIPLASACEVLKAAELYALSDLKRSCEEFLKQNTSIENVTGLLLAAEQFKVHSVRSFALDFVLWHFDSVSRDPAFARDILPRADLVREILLARRRGLLAYGSGVGPSSLAYPGAAPSFPRQEHSYNDHHYHLTGTTPRVGIHGVQGAALLPVPGNATLSTGPALAMAISFPQRLFADLKQLLHSGPLGFPDVKLVVNGCLVDNKLGCLDSAVEANDLCGQENLSGGDKTAVFYAHKVILCTRCEVLEAMLLRSAMREANSIPNTVVVPNIRPDVFKSLLSFLYMGRCELNYDNVFELYRAADQYCLSDLKDACEEFLMQEISLDNVGAVLLDSDVNLVNPIRSYAIDLSIREFDDVSVTQRFLEDVVPRQDLLLEIFQGRGGN